MKKDKHEGMITFSNQQIEKIGELRPLTDSKFTYNSTRWINLENDYKALIRDFENQDISRQDVIDEFKEYFSGNSQDYMKSFMLTMVWGFADTGYGTHRTNNYISSENNRTTIKNALDYINRNGQDSLKNAFNELKKIKGLGVSYLTKILYFATRAKNQDNYSLIFDIRVAASLVKLTTPKEIFEIVTIGPSSKFKDYENYNRLIHKLAIDNQVEADQLEMYLFNQVFV